MFSCHSQIFHMDEDALLLPSNDPLGSPSSVCIDEVFLPISAAFLGHWTWGRHSSEEGPRGTEFKRPILSYLSLPK